MKKARAVTIVAMILNICLLVVLIAAILHIALAGRPTAEADSAAPPEESVVQVMGAGVGQNPELDAWIANMKEMANRYGVEPMFLQELFPDQIVYSFKGNHIYADVRDDLSKHSYDWTLLQRNENNWYTYSGPSGDNAIAGIDVSEYQGDIDWEAVREDGVSYAILRAGFRGYGTGVIHEDEKLQDNLEDAAAAGMPLGVYFFSQAVDEAEAIEEADFVLEAIAGHDVAWPVVFDMEEIAESPNRTENLTAQQATDIALAFCNRVREAGYTPMVYGNVSWMLSMQQLERLQNEDIDIWFAQYRSKPWYPYQFTMWQYSCTSAVEGITGDVDMNLSFVEYGGVATPLGEGAGSAETADSSPEGADGGQAAPTG